MEGLSLTKVGVFWQKKKLYLAYVGKVKLREYRNRRVNYKLPRNSCSRSIDSNKALKFPLPKEVAPSRWIIS